ncbi:720_t:CDS:2, partial [Dentiscutata heterogama]
LAINESFRSADAIIPTLQVSQNYSRFKLTSKLLNFQILSKPVDSSLIPSAECSTYSISQNFSILDE